MAKAKNWGVVRRGEFANPIGQFRVADLAAVPRWWKTGQAYDFESYPTLAEAQARAYENADTTLEAEGSGVDGSGRWGSHPGHARHDRRCEIAYLTLEYIADTEGLAL